MLGTGCYTESDLLLKKHAQQPTALIVLLVIMYLCNWNENMIRQIRYCHSSKWKNVHQACILSHQRESAGRGDDYQLRIRKAQSKLDTLLWRESSLNSPPILSFLFEAKERHCSPSQTFLQGGRAVSRYLFTATKTAAAAQVLFHSHWQDWDRGYKVRWRVRYCMYQMPC